MARTSRAPLTLDWISRFRRPFLSLLFLAICLFAVLPQFASVDSDDDGITDLSAIVIGTSLFANPAGSAHKDERLLNSYITVASTSDANWRLPSGTNDAGLIFLDRHSILASLCVLRR